MELQNKTDIEWYQFDLPTTPLLKATLDKVTVNYLWRCIKDAKEKNINSNKVLAGNIGLSLQLEDKNEYFYNKVLKNCCRKYIEENSKVHCFRNNIGSVNITGMCLQEFWVNFQKKYEFNPIHDHTGAISFVIWMKIPTESEEQHNLPFSKHSNLPSASDFQFHYSDITGAHRGYNISMNPSLNDTIVVFPSSMAHQVYPFYECDDERVSISGNVYYNATISKE